MRLKKALLIVDLQNDFCPNGALPVPDGDKIVPTVNRYIKLFSKKGLPIFASRDWHPNKTSHFKQFGGVWPKHCVQKTKGAEFHPRLKLPKEVIIVSKGMDPNKDSYSAFESFDTNNTAFPMLLELFGIRELYICGLATGYCVRATALDALKAGYKVRLLIDAVRGVDIKPNDSQKAIEEMLFGGAKLSSFPNLRLS